MRAHSTRSISTRLITRWLRRPRALVVCAWFWLAGHTDSLDGKRRCLEAILGLDSNCEPASAALQGILLKQQTATHLRPANAEAIAEFIEGTGTEVLRGALRYPSESGDWQLGDIDLSGHPAQYMDPITSLPCAGQHSVRCPPLFSLYPLACGKKIEWLSKF